MIKLARLLRESTTVKQVQKELDKEYGKDTIKFYRGRGYFYFMSHDYDIPSLYVYSLDSETPESVLAHVKTHMEKLHEAYKRNYKKEYEQYHSKPEQKKRRAGRNGARRKMQRLGHVKKGDGKDVHHRNRNTKDNSSKNLAAISKSKNRGMK